MADSRGGQQGPRLPIKVILPNQGKERRVSGGGGKAEPFRPVTREYRASLGKQVEAIQNTIAPTIEATVGSVPLRVTVLPNAVAKRHRPERLFSPATCPIVGAGSLGELYVKGTPQGLANLKRMI